MKILGWIVVIVLGAVAIALWSTLPKPILIIVAVVTLLLVSRLLFAKRM